MKWLKTSVVALAIILAIGSILANGLLYGQLGYWSFAIGTGGSFLSLALGFSLYLCPSQKRNSLPYQNQGTLSDWPRAILAQEIVQEEEIPRVQSDPRVRSGKEVVQEEDFDDLTPTFESIWQNTRITRPLPKKIQEKRLRLVQQYAPWALEMEYLPTAFYENLIKNQAFKQVQNVLKKAFSNIEQNKRFWAIVIEAYENRPITMEILEQLNNEIIKAISD